MRGIAKEAGMSTGAIYHHYSSKEEVLYDVMRQSLSVSTHLAEKTRLNMDSKEELIAEIYENIMIHFDKSAENKLHLYLAQEAILGNEILRKKFKGQYKEWINATEELLIYIYGTSYNEQGKALASLLIGAIDGVVIQMLLGANIVPIEDIAKVYHLLLTDGIPHFMKLLSQQN
jgi:AcrR family transcriptional regulator